MRARCLAAAFLLLTPTIGAAQSRPPGLLAAYTAYGTAQALDVHSTRRALAQGAQEANPLLGGCVRSTGCFVAVKAVVTASTASTLWVVDQQLRKDHPKAAFWLTVSLTAFQVAVDVRNYRQGAAR